MFVPFVNPLKITLSDTNNALSQDSWLASCWTRWSNRCTGDVKTKEEIKKVDKSRQKCSGRPRGAQATSCGAEHLGALRKRWQKAPDAWGETAPRGCVLGVFFLEVLFKTVFLEGQKNIWFRLGYLGCVLGCFRVVYRCFTVVFSIQKDVYYGGSGCHITPFDPLLCIISNPKGSQTSFLPFQVALWSQASQLCFHIAPQSAALWRLGHSRWTTGSFSAGWLKV